VGDAIIAATLRDLGDLFRSTVRQWESHRLVTCATFCNRVQAALQTINKVLQAFAIIAVPLLLVFYAKVKRGDREALSFSHLGLQTPWGIWKRLAQFGLIELDGPAHYGMAKQFTPKVHRSSYTEVGRKIWSVSKCPECHDCSYCQETLTPGPHVHVLMVARGGGC